MKAGERRAGGARRSRHRAARTTVGRDGARHPQPRAPRRARRRPCARWPSGAYADRALHGEARGLEPRDRALAKQLAFGTVQRRLTLDHVIADATSTARARAAACAPRCSSGSTSCCSSTASPTHAAIAEAVELAKPQPRPPRSSTRCCAACSARASSCPSDDDARGRRDPPLAPALARASCGGTGSGADETRALLAADNEPAELALRVNALVDVRPRPTSPGRREGEAIVVDGPFDALAHPGYAAGAFTPQSRARAARRARRSPRSPASACSTSARRPGGKTTHLAALMGGEGEVVAVERHPGRARALRAHLRAHARRRTCTVVDGRRRRPSTTPSGFDRVLLDPPCSGPRDAALAPRPALARDARRPIDAPGRRAGRAAGRRARARCAPAGALVYSVCTLSPARGAAGAATTVQRTFPHVDGTDGFYIARDGG